MSATLLSSETIPAANALTDAERGELVLGCRRLCKRMAADAAEANPAHDAEDLEQEAMLACVLASQRWSPDAGTKFSTYATAFVRRHLAGVTTKHRGEGVVRLESWDAVAHEPADATEGRELTQREEYLLSRLKEPARSAVTLVLEGLPPDRAAEQLGMTVKDLKLHLRNAAMELAREVKVLDKPALFDPTPDADPWDQFVTDLAEVRGELFPDEEDE